MALNIVIMAAGKGTRMKSALPKVLHRIAGRPLLHHVLRAAATLAPAQCLVVTGHGAELVEASLQTGAEAAGLRAPLRCVRQEPQLGTGHAVAQALPWLAGDDDITLVLNGDVPLVRGETLAALVAACGGERLALLAVELADPTGYGRIVRSGSSSGGGARGGHVLAVVEENDASEVQRSIREVYAGILAAPTGRLRRWVTALRNDNAQREYYLTDVVAEAVADRVAVVTAHVADPTEVLGVNSASQLADLERRWQRVQAEALMDAGVRLADPARFDLRGTLECGRDVEIDLGSIFEGSVRIAEGAAIGAHCVLRDAEIGPFAVIHPYTHIDGAEVGAGAVVGPYARLRPGARLGADVHVGNFVEVKNASLGDGAKANHLSYLGDATVGERANIGAGTITANYDGARKHRTTIGADVHVGSNCVLVAPVTVGDGATVGGGSTITADVPPGKLAVARGRQVVIDGWQRPRKGDRAPAGG
jgi:bifunctional UDP-N-acetylglucosamine pyrophosphorylase/glucosamine-1-phosphate N-acetyltransferase